MTRHIFVFLSFLLVVTSCDDSRIYEKNVEISDKTWIADSVVHFSFQITDSRKSYNLYYNLRNSISYPFQNIYVNYTLEDTLGNELATELVNQNLFHPKTGKPFGDGLGDIFDHQFKLLENYRFNQPGAYRVKLQQFMRRDSLPEIISVGIRVEEFKREGEG